MDIPLHTLKEITSDFSDLKKIGKGGYGTVYKGILNGEHIAVKLLHYVQGFDENPFGNEFLNLLSIKHPHVIRLLGYCYEIQHKYVEHKGMLRLSQYVYRILCFEYMEGGSLENYLEECAKGSGDRKWRTRYNIIKGVCEGLNFLHEGCGKPIIHLDLKPANILLDRNMMAKIADFGLSRLSHGSSTRITESTVIGTEKYMPPDYKYEKVISTKNDVFSLGVIIIEVLDGSMGDYDFSQTHEVETFREQVNTNWRKWINATTSWCPTAELDQVDTCINIAIRCVDRRRTNRPTVAEILHILRETENFFPAEQDNEQFLLAQSLPTPTRSGLVGGTAGTPRDIDEKPCRLVSVTISYLGLVDAFSFSYIDQSGKNQTIGPWGDGYSLDKTETIHFGPSEFVEEVSGTCGVHFENVLVMSLTFVTNVATYGPFGNPYHQNVQTTPFSFRADEYSSITGFHGRSGQHIYSIGVYTCVSNKPSVRHLPPPGQSLPPPTKSEPVGGSAGSPRDVEDTPWRLDSFTIGYLGLVDAFSFTYTDQAGRKHSIGPWGEGYHHDKIETIRFGPSEVLEEVSGAYGNHFGDTLVMSLTFVTNARTYGPYGNPHHQNVSSTPFKFKADNGSSIVGFHGRSGTHIYSIGVYRA